MKYVLKLVSREGGREYREWDLDESDLSLAVGERPLFEMQVNDPRLGSKKVTISAKVEKL